MIERCNIITRNYNMHITIKITDIPEYLKTSLFVSNLDLDDEDNESITIPHFKSNTNISNHIEFIQLVNTVHFFGAPIPDSIWYYAFTNPDISKQVILQTNNSDLLQIYACILEKSIDMRSIISHSNSQALKVFIQYNQIGRYDDYEIYLYVAKIDAIECLKVLHLNGFPMDIDLYHRDCKYRKINVCEIASEYNSLSCFTFGIENSCLIGNSVNLALENGSTKILEYLHLNHISELEQIIFHPKENEYLYANSINIIRSVFSNDSVETLKFMWEKNYFDESNMLKLSRHFSINSAMYNGSVKCLEFLHSIVKMKITAKVVNNLLNNYSINDELTLKQIQCLKYLVKNNWKKYRQDNYSFNSFVIFNYDITLLRELIDMNLYIDYSSLYISALKNDKCKFIMDMHDELKIPFPPALLEIFRDNSNDFVVVKNKNEKKRNQKNVFNTKSSSFMYICDNIIK